MIDIQSQPDERGVDLDEVGVCDLGHPLAVQSRAREMQRTIGRFTMSVSVPHHIRGTHMSRFVEILNQHNRCLTTETAAALLRSLRARLGARRARMEVVFPFFSERQAPVSGGRSLLECTCLFSGECDEDDHVDAIVGATVPVTTLCPCSKAISDYGAHSQRGLVTIEVRLCRDASRGAESLSWEDLIDIAERSASSPVFPLLKRSDERHVTMRAYDNPAFVEDVVRNVALRLSGEERITWFRVHTVNHESIHHHNAFARIERACGPLETP